MLYYVIILDYLSLQQLCYHVAKLCILTQHVDFPSGRKPEYSEKTRDVQQNVDWLFHMSVLNCDRTYVLIGA